MKTPMDVSVIIIGRNEGARLASCLESVTKAIWGGISYEVIYIDSRSTDDSLTIATSHGAKAILLDDDQPCAAKARNLGISQAKGQMILFLDGDTILDEHFVLTAIKVLDSAPQTCAVWGHRRELLPNQSIFTKVMDLDWIYPIGKTLYFGGDVLIRRTALEEVNGYDPTLKAGEEPEMCARLRAAGWEIEHIDTPMTLHDLAVNTFRGYWLRAYRSGIAYAELAERMRKRGDSLWQKDSKRDYLHGWLYLLSPVLFIAALLMPKYIGLGVIGIGILGVGLIILKTARGSKWKSPHNPILTLQYAVHVHLQKVPSLFGQLAWRRNHETSQKLIEYKTASDERPTPAQKGRLAKRFLIGALTPLAKLWTPLVTHGWSRIWGLACLRAQLQHDVDASNVIQGSVEIHGTGNIRFGKNALIYPDCYLETQGDGEIILGDDIVLSRGVHIVAFTKVSIGTGTIIGEYSSVRDANHRLSKSSIRNSGHDTQAISIGNNVWIARGVTVLKGVTVGNNAVVAAGAVVNRSVPENDIVAGLPARPIKARPIISAASPIKKSS